MTRARMAFTLWKYRDHAALEGSGCANMMNKRPVLRHRGKWVKRSRVTSIGEVTNVYLVTVMDKYSKIPRKYLAGA